MHPVNLISQEHQRQKKNKKLSECVFLKCHFVLVDLHWGVVTAEDHRRAAVTHSEDLFLLFFFLMKRLIFPPVPLTCFFFYTSFASRLWGFIRLRWCNFPATWNRLKSVSDTWSDTFCSPAVMLTESVKMIKQHQTAALREA